MLARNEFWLSSSSGCQPCLGAAGTLVVRATSLVVAYCGQVWCRKLDSTLVTLTGVDAALVSLDCSSRGSRG